MPAPCRKDDDAADAHAVDFPLRSNGEVADGLVLEEAEEVFDGDHTWEFQIVMLFKGGPPGAIRLVNFEVEDGTPSKTPPGKLPRRCIEDRARLQPVENNPSTHLRTLHATSLENPRKVTG
jgi:hypothetical protein